MCLGSSYCCGGEASKNITKVGAVNIFLRNLLGDEDLKAKNSMILWLLLNHLSLFPERYGRGQMEDVL